MDYRVSYEHSLESAPDDYIAKVPSQVVKDVPANIPRALLPEFISDLILKRSVRIGRYCRNKAGWTSKRDCYVLLMKRASRTAVRRTVGLCQSPSSALS